MEYIFYSYYNFTLLALLIIVGLAGLLPRGLKENRSIVMIIWLMLVLFLLGMFTPFDIRVFIIGPIIHPVIIADGPVLILLGVVKIRKHLKADFENEHSAEERRKHLLIPIASIIVGSFLLLGTILSHTYNDDWEFEPLRGKILLTTITNHDSVSSGNSHCLVIMDDGSLWAWGRNEEGQLGDGTTSYRYAPVKIMDGVASASAGSWHSLAIKTDGTLWAWGNNFDGAIGDGTVSYYTPVSREYVDNNRPAPVKIMDNVAFVSAGNSHSLAIKTDGSLWAWGSNFYGALGDGTASYEDPISGEFVDNNRSTPVMIMRDVAFVAAGDCHSLAVKKDGSLWAWGGNINGQLGDGTITIMDENFTIIVDNNKSTPIRVLDGVVTASAGVYHSYAVKTDGSLWVWGAYGIVTDENHTDEHYFPVEIMDNLVHSVSGGWHSSYIIKADGSLWQISHNEENIISSWQFTEDTD